MLMSPGVAAKSTARSAAFKQLFREGARTWAALVIDAKHMLQGYGFTFP
jgi:hypothetical protein